MLKSERLRLIRVRQARRLRLPGRNHKEHWAPGLLLDDALGELGCHPQLERMESSLSTHLSVQHMFRPTEEINDHWLENRAVWNALWKSRVDIEANKLDHKERLEADEKDKEARRRKTLKAVSEWEEFVSEIRAEDPHGGEGLGTRWFTLWVEFRREQDVRDRAERGRRTYCVPSWRYAEHEEHKRQEQQCLRDGLERE